MICDFCKTDCTSEYTDGKTWMGPWANMCPACTKRYHIGVYGIGRGQLYKDGKKIKG